MSFAPLLSSRDGSSVRVNSEPPFAIKRENRREPATLGRPGAGRVFSAAGERLDVPVEAHRVQHTVGPGLIKLVLCRGGTPIFLNPSLVLAIEDRSGGSPHATSSLVTITTSSFSTGAGHSLASPFMVRETAQQIMEAIMTAEIAEAPGPSKVLDRCADVGIPRFAPDPSYPQVRRRGPAVACTV